MGTVKSEERDCGTWRSQCGNPLNKSWRGLHSVEGLGSGKMGEKKTSLEEIKTQGGVSSQ